ncbi:DUF1104 domain-containing protein [Campylobacter sp. faydin G-24]|uniref:DUF1104 domain-containing protein n=1 Tax=Campylobacter anatolicus TaxID=2829105 RepID=A0ABS5HFS4_9BACT|nr:DUF1104 domain-containing protein [Campylobacter anatolicus]MBR8462435.1 DUF1104 domain-containing protein [Campylobacter anatolicus]MBR8463116.1 DUF1104 domain-containing protein [Campylobacter anatolicus]MBR8465563.1 DUF1104 domain-containing protein [Campylobacter anatolicus]
MFLSKTKVAVFSILVASSLFAVSIKDSTNAELSGMIANADAKTLSEISLEMHKRAGKLQSEAMDIKDDFRDAMHKKISSMSDTERSKFMDEYKGLMRDKMDSLSVKEARSMDIMGDIMGEKHGCSAKMKDKNSSNKSSMCGSKSDNKGMMSKKSDDKKGGCGCSKGGHAGHSDADKVDNKSDKHVGHTH